MPSLYKRGSVYYVASFQDGKRIYKSTGKRTKQDAFQFLLEHQRGKRCPPRLTLSAYLDKFLEYAKDNYTPANFSNTRRVLKQFLLAHGDRQLASITPLDIESWKSTRLQATRGLGSGRVQRISPVSVNSNLRVIRAAFGYAVRWGLLEKNPMATVTFLRVPERSRAHLSLSDLQLLLSRIPERWLRDMVLLGVLTGLRRGEMLHLRWQDVDLGKRILRVENGPGFRTKSGKPRVVPLNHSAVTLLRQGRAHGQSDMVFSAGGRPLTPSWVTHRFKHRIRVAGLPEDIHFHSLRHTFASWLAQDGVSLYAIQKLLGHSSPNVTQIYSHLQPDQMHETVNRLSLRLN